ncbi:MAG TPA: hypothetical protein VMY41_09275 [Thermohalobaculum sp.]|nr:hypothetical protein [Thermohalobaculum sp.]
MTPKSLRRALLAISAGVLISSPALSQSGGQAPMPPGAYPVIQQCAPNQPVPTLPDVWSTTALLTPFDQSELKFAKVIVGSAINTMLATTIGLESGTRDQFLIVEDKTYRGITDQNGNPQYVPIWQDNWLVPPTNLFYGKGCSCEGISYVSGVEAEAWKCPSGAAQPAAAGHRGAAQGKATEYDWFWFTAAASPAERVPLRFLMSRPDNDQKLPVLGDAALVNMPEVTTATGSSAEAQELGKLAEAAASGGVIPDSQLRLGDPSIPGVSFAGCGSFTLPTWPQTAYSDGALFAVGGSYTSMLIYYDYPNLREVSKIRGQDGSVNDTRLTSDTTWEIFWPSPGPDQGAPVQCQGGLKNVGIWHPNWPTRDACACRAGIAANSPLNPSGDDLNALSCFFGGSAYIQSWYSTAGRPHLFYETNAGDLDLIDYYNWIPNAQIDPSVFDDPGQCMQGQSDIVAPFCADCHGGEIGWN